KGIEPLDYFCAGVCHQAFACLLRRDELGELLERAGVVHGQVGQNLAINLDRLGPQRMNEARVAHTIGLTSRIDTLDPQATHIALAEFAADVGVLPRLMQNTHRLAVTILTASREALGLLENTLVTAAGDRTALYARHDELLEQ